LLSKIWLINIFKKIQLSFFSFEISLFQKFTILNFIHNISIGVLPSSSCVIKFGVVVLTPKIFLQNWRWSFSSCLFKWLKIIKSIFEKTGLNYLWNQQQPVHSVQLKFIVKQNLTDQYIQNWFNQIENLPKPTLHRWQIRSSLGVFDHLPVSIGSLMLLHLNFVIMFLSCGNNFNKIWLINIFKTGLTKLRTLLGENFMAYLKMNLI
jgi:hypothetical protein